MAGRLAPNAVLDAKYYLGVLCLAGQPDAGEYSFFWFVQGRTGQWVSLAQNVLPQFPDPIPVRLRGG